MILSWEGKVPIRPFFRWYKFRNTRVRNKIIASLLLSILVALLILEYFKYLLVASPYSRASNLNFLDEETPVKYPSSLNDLHKLGINIDHSHRSKADILRDLQKAFPNLPITFWEENKGKRLYYENRSCARFPGLYDLEFSELDWQVQRTTRATFYLYGAYYDVREYSWHPSIRILALVDSRVTITTYCQIWFPNSTKPFFAQVSGVSNLWGPRAPYDPKLLTCRIPEPFTNQIPIRVSLVENMCDIATNTLLVNYNKLSDGEKRSKVAVCVKRQDYLYEDRSVRFIEWIELVRQLGAKKIYFYVLKLHANITKVLKYYEKEGLVEITLISLPGKLPNNDGFQKLYYEAKKGCQMSELLTLHDCFYKYMYMYEYIAIFDTDEIIVPLKDDNWTALIDRCTSRALLESNESRCYLRARGVHFRPYDDATEREGKFKDIPPYMYMLQHIYREQKTSTFKSFLNTERVYSFWQHWPSRCLGKSRRYDIPEEDAQMQHYRVGDYDSENVRKSWGELVQDSNLWRYVKPLMERSMMTLYNLEFFG